MRSVQHLGFVKPTEIQQEAIPAVMVGRDLIVSSQTGSGKTLAYLLPMMQRLLKSRPLSKRDARALILARKQRDGGEVAEAPNMADARAMVTAVEAAGKILMVHENFRWQSAIREALRVVQSGAIGTPFFGRVSFRSGYDVFSGQPYLAEGKRFIIEDLGIHILDIARAFFGDVAQLSATTRRINPAIKGEDVATMLLTHAGGAASVVDCSYATRRVPEIGATKRSMNARALSTGIESGS